MDEHSHLFAHTTDPDYALAPGSGVRHRQHSTPLATNHRMSKRANEQMRGVRDALAHANSDARRHAYAASCLEACQIFSAIDHTCDKRHTTAWQSPALE